MVMFYLVMQIRILSGFKYIRLIQTLIVVKNIHENKNNKKT